MSDTFKLEGAPIDLEGLGQQIERRIPTGPDDPPARDDPPAGPGLELGSGSAVELLLSSLSEDADVAQGFPPQSHRKLGSAVVAAKKGFRLALQPLINDAFARQKVFNRRLLDTLAALHSENRALEARLKRLEALLARESTDS
jgi:hypothetical protein